MGLNAIERDYRSIFEFFFAWLRINEFRRVYERLYATDEVRFCIVFRALSLRFARLVQARGKP